MGFHIEQAAEDRGSFGRYNYRIYRDGRLIAYYWHDHKGDDHGIEFINGKSGQLAAWRMTDFIEGGGPEPLRLSDLGAAYLIAADSAVNGLNR